MVFYLVLAKVTMMCINHNNMPNHHIVNLNILWSFNLVA